MGEFSFERALAMAKAAEQGEPLPSPEPHRPVKKPATQFDFDAAMNRAKQGRSPRVNEDRDQFAKSA